MAERRLYVEIYVKITASDQSKVRRLRRLRYFHYDGFETLLCSYKITDTMEKVTSQRMPYG